MFHAKHLQEKYMNCEGRANSFSETGIASSLAASDFDHMEETNYFFPLMLNCLN